MGEAVVADLRTRRREQTSAEILAAAWVLAERDGLAGLSLRDVAAAVGMRAPSLYTYFASKAAIYDAMFVEGYEALDAMLAEQPLDPEQPAAALVAGAQGYLDFCLASIPRYQLMFTLAIPGWAPSAEAYAASTRSYAAMTERFRILGIVGQDALDLWTAMTAGLAAQQIANDPSGERWRRRVPEVVELYLHHLRR